MKVCTKKIITDSGASVRKAMDMRRLLNLGHLYYLDKAMPSEKYGLPELKCDTKVLPDYIALYSQVSLYSYTLLTCVGFYQFDNIFDGKDGFINAFVYGDKKLIKKYRKRFENVQMFIMPDCSMFGDLDLEYNKEQLKRALLGALILSIEFNKVVLPNITYISEETFPLYFDAIKNCSVVAISLKGHIRYSKERRLLKAAIKYAVDNMPNLSTFVVYSVCGKDETAYKVLDYAVKNGIKICIPQNTLRERNMRRCGR